MHRLRALRSPLAQASHGMRACRTRRAREACQCHRPPAARAGSSSATWDIARLNRAFGTGACTCARCHAWTASRPAAMRASRARAASRTITVERVQPRARAPSTPRAQRGMRMLILLEVKWSCRRQAYHPRHLLRPGRHCHHRRRRLHQSRARRHHPSRRRHHRRLRHRRGPLHRRPRHRRLLTLDWCLVIRCCCAPRAPL